MLSRAPPVSLFFPGFLRLQQRAQISKRLVGPSFGFALGVKNAGGLLLLLMLIVVTVQAQ